MVVIAHYCGEVPHGLSGFAWGWLGVSIFFVLSGFLIGGIVLDQKDDDGFFRSFWVKRAGRILPAYLVVLAVVFAAAGLFADRDWMTAPHAPGWYLTFTQNVAIAFQGEGSKWLAPLWTLAVEEQFYLLLPPLMVLLPRRALVPTLALLWAAALPFRWMIHGVAAEAALTLLPSRMDLLLAGVLAAVALRRTDLSRFLTPLRIAPLVAVLAVLLVGLTRDHRLFMIVSPTLVSLGAAAYILALALGAPEGRRLSGPVTGFLGTISYSLYLYHQPIAGLMHGLILGRRPDIDSPAAVAVTFAAVAVSIGAAWASWRWLEAPILTWARSRRPAPHPVREGA